MKIRKERGRLTTGRGFDGEMAVKQKLWNYGYSVKHLVHAKYDLLVDEHIRVEVKTTHKYQLSVDGGFQWPVCLNYRNEYDVMAFVLHSPVGDPYILFMTHDMVKKTFPGAWGGTIRITHPDDWNKYGFTSPYDVFGKPQRAEKEEASK